MPSHLAQSTAIALIAGTLFQLTPTMTLAEEKSKVDWAFELTYEGDQRRSLGDGQGDHLTKLTPQVTVEIEHELADDVTGYIELEFGHDRILDHGWRRSEDHESALDLKQFYLKFEEIRPGLTMMLGRQDLKDDRKWYFDEELDGARFVHERNALTLEASITRELVFKKNILESTPDEDAINNYFLKAGYEVSDGTRLSAYLLVRDGMSGVDEELIYYGFSARGAFSDNLTYWGDLAYLRGRDDDDSLSSYGLDIGGSYLFDAALQPSFTLAYALGTGDDGGHRDRRFRQSGLEGNESRFNGIEDFLYYGEALDPELSNVRILTAGFGIRPTEKSSIDIVAHRYSQDVATSGRLPGAAVHAETTGDSRNIGTGIDLIFGYREVEDVALGLRLGWFKPGDAFDEKRTMFSVQAGFDYEF